MKDECDKTLEKVHETGSAKGELDYNDLVNILGCVAVHKSAAEK